MIQKSIEPMAIYITKRISMIFVAAVMLASASIPAVASAATKPVSTKPPQSVDGLPSARWIVPKNPRAVVIVIHGGSWYGGDPIWVDAMVPYAQQLSSKANAATMNIDYHSGAGSLPDVVTSYDRARQKFPNLPICAAGWSAGGNLALLLATKRPLDCVISEAGITNIRTGSQDIKDVAHKYFGPPSNWAKWSPVYATKKIRSPTLIVSATNDQLVLHSQAVEFKKRFPKSTLVTLKPGTGSNARFIHSEVDAAQLAKARNLEIKLILQASNTKK